MPVELKCDKCGKTASFAEAEIKDRKAECPHCGSTIRVKEEPPADLSQTMRIDTNNK